MSVVSASVLIANSDLFAPVRYCGKKSLYIYLAFFLPMATTRTVLLKTGLIDDVGTVALIVTLAAIIGALAIYWLARDTRLLGFLFERPQWTRLKPARQVRLHRRNRPPAIAAGLAFARGSISRQSWL